ncbi:MAG: LCP family protein [Oscillospiraceae bacterium]|nr:LCP family protein [Oscillospiraceae bacterium]
MNLFKQTGSKTKKRQPLRRRSNWYIYLITFASTSIMLGLFVLALSPILFAQNNTAHKDWRNYYPDSELDTIVLFMLSSEQGGIPHRFMLMNYRPRDNVIELVPLSENTHVQTRAMTGSLINVYRTGGADLVMEGIKTTLGVECEFHVKFDRVSFTSLTAGLGDITVNIIKDFESGGVLLKAGEHQLSGGDLFVYMTYVTADDELAVMGRAMTFMINYNLRNMDEESISMNFNRVLNNAATNLEFKNYVNYYVALHYTSNNSINPASFFVPIYEQEDGALVMTESSINAIHDRFNIITTS